MKIQKLLSENTSLGDEVRGAQENLRLSTATQAKLKAELEQFRNQITQNIKNLIPTNKRFRNFCLKTIL